MHPSDTLPCFQAHLGLWAIEPRWLSSLVYGLQHGFGPVPREPQPWARYTEAFAADSVQHFSALAPRVERRESALYSQIDDVALIRIVDQMTKMPSKFGGTSTILTRRAIREAVANEEIHAILIAVDSPGGMVAGTMELTEEIRRASTEKPVAAYYEDLAASAAVWATAYAQRITANSPAQIGSVGVVAELVDTSGLAEREGLKVHVISTGTYKGLGAPGTAIEQPLLDEVRKIVTGIGAHFFTAVEEGRKVSKQRMEIIKTGQLWLAPEAMALGLIDGVETFDQALATLRTMRRKPKRTLEQQARMAGIRDRIFPTINRGTEARGTETDG